MVLMSSDDFEKRKDAEIKSLTPIKNSFFLLGLIELSYLIIVTVQVLSSLLSTLLSDYSGENVWFISIIFEAVSDSFYAIFMFIFLLMLNRGIEESESFIPDLKIARTGVIILALGIVLLIPMRVAETALSAFGMYLLIASLLVGAVTFVGFILIMIGVWRIGAHYRVSDVKTGVLLSIFLSFIGSFYLYFSFDKVIDKIKRRMPPPPIPPWI